MRKEINHGYASQLAWGEYEKTGEISNYAEVLLVSHDELARGIAKAKHQAITELLALHEQDRAKVNSQCDTLINMSTVRKYLEELK